MVKNKIKYIILTFLLITVIASGLVVQQACQPTPTARAVVVSENNFDSTAIEDDLADMDLGNYPKDPEGEPRLVQLVEYCYTNNVFKQGHYGLYLYIYNPAQIPFSMKPGSNTVNMATSYDESGEPTEYNNVSLTYLAKTTEPGYEGLLYKFRVTDSTSLLDTAYEYSKAHGERRYDIAGVQLRDTVSGDTQDIGVSYTFHYTGYAKGYGTNTSADSTLDCEITEMETVELEVHGTFYRPEGFNDTDIYTRDQLSSVYFAVPNKLDEAYDRLYAVKAEWYKALTDEILVTDNENMYNDLYKYLGSSGGSYGFGRQGVIYPLYYNDFRTEIHEVWENPLGVLNYIFLVTASQSVEDYVVSAETLEDFIIARSADCADKFLDKYDPGLFESIDSEKTVAEVTADIGYDLKSTVIGDSWWDELFCNYETETYEGIEAIHKVTDSDFVKGSNGEIDAEATSNKLYIDKYDYEAFKAFYDESIAADKTVYLLRYDQTEYVSVNVKLWTRAQDMFGNTYNAAATGNGYVAKVPAYLGFDIISLTYEREGEYYVIPAVSDPIDIFSDVTPPPNWEPGHDAGLPLWLIIVLIVVGVILLLILLPILWPLIKLLLKGIVWIICLPFRFIGWIVKKIRGDDAEK